MASERIQRRIDRLLDQAEEAADRRDWTAAVEHAREVLAFDAENADALAIIAAAAAMDQPGVPHLEEQRAEQASATLAPIPDSFASGRYVVRRFLGEGGKKRRHPSHLTVTSTSQHARSSANATLDLRRGRAAPVTQLDGGSSVKDR